MRNVGVVMASSVLSFLLVGRRASAFRTLSHNKNNNGIRSRLSTSALNAKGELSTDQTRKKERNSNFPR
eukprot:scaffold326_cov165-Amphora_coffeaeformis.AAC.7